MNNSNSVRFRLLRDSADPPSPPDGSAVRFGLQDSENGIQPPVTRADGMLAFEFELKAKTGPDPEHPVFTGLFASGPRDERFVYLAWQRVNGQGYVNRVKIRLADVGWPLVREAQRTGRPLECDASGRKAGGGRVVVEWKLGEA